MDPQEPIPELPESTATAQTESGPGFGFEDLSDEELLKIIHGEGAGAEVDSSINRVILTVVGGFVFRGEPKVKDRYINDTEPILDAVGFHTCFGILGYLTPGVRLGIGLLAIVGMAVFLKWELKREEQPKQEEKSQEGEPVETTSD